MLTRKKGTALTAIVLGATLSLTGCFGNPLENLVNQGIEGGIGGIVEDATGGVFGMTEGEVPAGFPNEVPLIDGKIQGGFAVTVDDANTWTVTVIVSGGTVPQVAEHITGQLTGAGFEAAEGTMATEEMTISSFTKEPFTVLATVTTTD